MRKYCKEHLRLAFATCIYCKEENTFWEEVLFCKKHGNEMQSLRIGPYSAKKKCECEEFEGHYMWSCPCGASHSYGGEKYPQEPMPKEECSQCKS